MYNFTYAVIGAGVVGLAVARELSALHARDGDLIVVEKETAFGRGISSRNSEVIHSGIYYPTGSLKHRLCVSGRRLLYEYCAKNKIPHRKCGKLIIAVSEQEKPELERLLNQARENNIENVIQLNKEESLRLEPSINVVSSLLVKETGIIDSHSLMKELEREIKNNNGTMLYSAAVASIAYKKNSYLVELADGSAFSARHVINSAGLSAAKVAACLMDTVKIYPCRGVYYSYSGGIKCGRLVYPVPDKNLTGLGIHATIDLAGHLRFGPDAEYIGRFDDFSIDDRRKELFFLSAKKIFNDILPDELAPDMAGIRPKIQGPDDKEVKDFYIKEEADNGFPGFINLMGIESPGLTSSLAIGEYILAMIENKPQ